MADSAPRRRGAAAAVTAGTAVGASPSGGPHGRRAWRWLAGAASVVAAAALAYLLRSVLWPFVLAAFLAYALAPAVEAGTARGLPRATATLLVFAAAGGAVVGVGAWVLPALAAEWVRAGDAIVQIAAQLEALQVSVERRYAPLLPALDLREALGSALERLQGQVLRDAGAVVANLPAWFQTLAGVALSPFLAYYMLRDLPRFREVFHRSLPPGWRGPAASFLAEVDQVLAGFIRGQLAVAACVGVLVATGLWLLGVRFALLLGLLAGVMDLLPYLGPFLGALPGVALGFAESWRLGLRVTLVYVAVQQIEAAVLAPRVVGRRVGLHPLVVIFSLLVGGHFFGLAGALLAVPAAGLVRAVARFGLRLVFP